MKNLNFLKFFFGVMLLIATVVAASCVDDNDDTEAPFLKVSPTSLNFTTNGTPAEGSQATFEISTNRHWTATIEGNKPWVTLSATEGDGSATVQVSIPEGITDKASIVIEISNKVGPLLQETVTITSGSVVPGVAIYHETFGTEAPDKSPYPFVDQYTGWVKSGEGSATVEYSGSATSLRQSGKLSAGYEDASGGTKLFFGANANFVINKVSLTNDQTNLRLTFGGSYSKNVEGVYDNVFKPEKFHFYLSADGVSWSNAIEYSTQQADEYWVFATSNFTLKSAVSILYIKYAADEASVFSIDDPTLSTGNGGTVIDLGGGSVDPEPGDATPITIPDLIEMMTTAQVPVDANADRYFEAVVQSDVAGGNYTVNNLALATEGATTAGNGITLFGSQVDPATLNVTKGDKVKVTLYRGLAKVVKYNGMYEVTGGKDDTWAKVEKIGNANITPIVITSDRLAEYQGMAVTIKDATPEAAGVWATSTDNSIKFTTEGAEFTVFCKKDATAFSNVPFAKIKGSITGLAAVYKNNAQLVPRNLADVSAFSTTDPMIVSVTPSTVSFPATGGTVELSVEVINQGDNTLSATGLSGILSATVNGTKVTVNAESNSNTKTEDQTLTITLTNGSKITVPVSVAAQGGGNQTILTADLTVTANYPSTFPLLAANKTVEPKTFSFNGHNYVFAGSTGNGYYQAIDNTTKKPYVINGKLGAYIELPVITDKKLTKVTVTTRVRASANVMVAITDGSNNEVTGGTAIKWAQTDGQLDYTYNLSGTSVNTKYRIYIASAYNAQFDKWELTYE